jgi:hypothetical protein
MILGAESANARERRLLKRFRALSTGDRETLEAFAEFLAQRRSGRHTDQPEATPPVVEREPRPAQETVMAAIKRLRRGYPQLDTGDLFNEVSLLMSSHLLQGRPAAEVIDELEALFARYAGDADPPHRNT